MKSWGHRAAVALFFLAHPVTAQQTRELSLQEALNIAVAQSEGLRIAQAGVMRAQGQQMQARSQYLPQFGGSINYTRTLATQFSALQSAGPPVPPPGTPPVPPPDTTSYYTPCTRYLAAATASDAERVSALENYARCSSGGGGGIDFSRVGFGSLNQYSIGLSGNMVLYSGGRVQAQNRAAAAGRRSADVEVAAQRAQVLLTATEAYYDAVLADRLVAIAESSLVQTEGTLSQTRLARQVGNQSEFELLRAQVTRDNQLPALMQRKTDRDLAYMRLKQLLNVPFSESVSLTTPIDEGAQVQGRAVSNAGLPVASADTSADARATVRQLEESLRASEANLAVARSQWIPTISLSSQYAKLNFPSDPAPGLKNWLTNWSVAVGASFPIFTGGANQGGTMIAQATVDDSRARLQQTRELAALEARQVLAQLEQAEAQLAASAGTSEQAARAYSIADVRYREGISTQLELSESRLLLEQARANRALAARNVNVARMRLALLKDLPLGAGASAAGFALPATQSGGSGAGAATGGGVQPGAGSSAGGGQATAPAAATSVGSGRGGQQ
jgi:outer membrane protein TolC